MTTWFPATIIPMVVLIVFVVVTVKRSRDENRRIERWNRYWRNEIDESARKDGQS